MYLALHVSTHSEYVENVLLQVIAKCSFGLIAIVKSVGFNRKRRARGGVSLSRQNILMYAVSLVFGIILGAFRKIVKSDC
jgi:hypothetical protein